MKTTLLLTTTVKVQSQVSWLKQKDAEERKKMYEEIIGLWLEKTNLNIVVTENSGYNFENLKKKFKKYINRFEIISFSYNQIPKVELEMLNNFLAKGQHEIYAINYACQKSKLIYESDFVIKITGRYFVPKLEEILTKNMNNLTDGIRQSQMWRNMNRCEIIGCSFKNINFLFKFPAEDDMLEQEYCNRMKNLKNILNLPKMKLHKKTRQGAGGLMKYL